MLDPPLWPETSHRPAVLARRQGWGGRPGPGSSPCRAGKVALGPARTHGLRAAAEGPATWRTGGRKLAAGGRVGAETTGDHAEYGAGKPAAGAACSGAGGAWWWWWCTWGGFCLSALGPAGRARGRSWNSTHESTPTGQPPAPPPSTVPRTAGLGGEGTEGEGPASGDQSAGGLTADHRPRSPHRAAQSHTVLGFQGRSRPGPLVLRPASAPG